MSDAALSRRLARLEGEAVGALAMSLLGLIVCQVAGPFAMAKAASVNRKLRGLGRPPNPKAILAFWLGVVGTVLLLVGLLFLAGALGVAVFAGQWAEQA